MLLHGSWIWFPWKYLVFVGASWSLTNGEQQQSKHKLPKELKGSKSCFVNDNHNSAGNTYIMSIIIMYQSIHISFCINEYLIIYTMCFYTFILSYFYIYLSHSLSLSCILWHQSMVWVWRLHAEIVEDPSTRSFCSTKQLKTRHCVTFPKCCSKLSNKTSSSPETTVTGEWFVCLFASKSLTAMLRTRLAA